MEKYNLEWHEKSTHWLEPGLDPGYTQVLAGLSNWLLETGAKDESLVVAGEALDKFIDVFSEDTQVNNSMYMTWM